MRISKWELWRENMDTHRIGKEHGKNCTHNEDNCVKCHVSGLT